jgi:hypothetical protein
VDGFKDRIDPNALWCEECDVASLPAGRQGHSPHGTAGDRDDASGSVHMSGKRVSAPGTPGLRMTGREALNSYTLSFFNNTLKVVPLPGSDHFTNICP